jgi:hypothetical protein
MPLHSDHRLVGQLHRLDQMIHRPRDRARPRSDDVDALVILAGDL